MLNTKKIEVRQTGDREIRVLVNNNPEKIITIDNPSDPMVILDCIRRAYAYAFVQAELWGSLGYNLKLIKPGEFDTPYLNEKTRKRSRNRNYGFRS